MTGSYALPATVDELPVAVRADGLRIWDTAGREYLDACGGAMVMALGHRHPRLIAAAKKQLDEISFTYRFSFDNAAAAKLAELLRDIAPMRDAWSFFNSSGSESIESAIHLALLYWQRLGHTGKTELIGRFPGFHGSTMGALSLSGSKWRISFDDVLAANAVAQTPNADIRRRTTPDVERDFGVAQLATAIDAIGADRVAAVFIEPITGASAAAVVPPDGYLRAVRDLCDERDVLLVADETITGFGRTGQWWATQHWDVEPDICTFAKGVTSGVIPFSGLLVNDRVARVLVDSGGFPYGHTFSGSPLGCAVAAAAVETIRDEGLVQRAATVGTWLNHELSEIAAASPYVGQVRGRGMLWGLELVADKQSLSPLAGGAARLRRLAVDEGLMIYSCPTPLADQVIEAVLIAPPLNTSDDDLRLIFTRLRTALTRLQSP